MTFRFEAHPCLLFFVTGGWDSANHISTLPAESVFSCANKGHKREPSRLEEEKGFLPPVCFPFLFVLMHQKFFILAATVVPNSGCWYQFAVFSYFRICLTMPLQESQFQPWSCSLQRPKTSPGVTPSFKIGIPAPRNPLQGSQAPALIRQWVNCTQRSMIWIHGDPHLSF